MQMIKHSPLRLVLMGPELPRCGVFSKEILKNTWMCSVEMSTSWMEAGRQEVDPGDKQRTKTF